MYRNTYQHIQFQTIIFDLDSTLVTIEGIDDLARMKGVDRFVAPMTKQAMEGLLSFEDIFFKRLHIIQPTYRDLVALGERYTRFLTEGARAVVAFLQEEGARVFVVSGGYNPAVSCAARSLGIPDDHVFANVLKFTKEGSYMGVDLSVPLWKDRGKQDIVHRILERFPGRSAFIGDSMGDFHAGALTDRFICFAGVSRREAVMERALSCTDASLEGILAFLN